MTWTYTYIFILYTYTDQTITTNIVCTQRVANRQAGISIGWHKIYKDTEQAEPPETSATRSYQTGSVYLMGWGAYFLLVVKISFQIEGELFEQQSVEAVRSPSQLQ